MTRHARVHLLNCADGREDLPRRAVAALKAIAVQEGGLHRVKLIAFGEAFNGDDVLALARRRKRQTGQDTLAFDDDRACAARALIAPLLRAGQTEHVAKSVQQRQARVQREFVGRVVNADMGFLTSSQPASITVCREPHNLCGRVFFRKKSPAQPDLLVRTPHSSS